jgi:hypothetical protein
VTSVGQLISEVTALGCRFRLSGAGLAIEGLGCLPLPLRQALREHAGFVWSILDDGCDVAPIKIIEALGITPVVAETCAEARSAVRELIANLRDHGGPIGLDTETSPRPEYAKPRPFAVINKDGCISAKQPGDRDHKDPAGPDPLRASIQLLQLFAGGNRCFVFRGKALDLLTGSNWLRRQWIVAHNAGFEIGFLQQVGYRAPTGRKPLGRFDCTEQAVGLCIGVGFGGENRSLENAASAMLGVEFSKRHQLSDWSAKRLSPGQIAYAAHSTRSCVAGCGKRQRRSSPGIGSQKLIGCSATPLSQWSTCPCAA